MQWLIQTFARLVAGSIKYDGLLASNSTPCPIALHTMSMWVTSPWISSYKHNATGHWSCMHATRPVHQRNSGSIMTNSIKDTDQVWRLRDDLCRIETQKATKYVLHFAVHVNHSHMYRTHLHHVTSQQNSGLWLIASRQRYWSSLEAQRWELGPSKLRKLMCTLCCTCETPILTCTEHTSTMSPVRIMTNSIKTKILIKFGGSEMTCVELRPRKLQNVYTLPYMWTQ